MEESVISYVHAYSLISPNNELSHDLISAKYAMMRRNTAGAKAERILNVANFSRQRFQTSRTILFT